MRAVIQAVSSASVRVNGGEPRAIGPGLMILLGVKDTDSLDIVPKLADKCAGLRIFPDAEGKLNLSARDLGYSALVVSQFTLYGDTKKGYHSDARNIDLRLFRLLGLCGSDRRFHAEGSSDKIRLSRWRPSWSGGFGRLRLLVRFRNIGFVDFRRMSQERFRPTLFLLVLKSLASLRIKPVHRSWTKKSAWC